MRKGFLLGWLGAAGLALAMLPAPAAAQTFSGSTEVVEVEVPVQVVRDGQPVRGLTAADFELYEGRQKLADTGFHEIYLASPAARGGVPPAGRRQLLLLFDLAFSNPKAVVAAREAARALVLKGVRPGDLVGVATYSTAHGSQILLGLTSDRTQVDTALAALGSVRGARSGGTQRIV